MGLTLNAVSVFGAKLLFLQPGIGLYQGYNQYRIGGETELAQRNAQLHFPVSELHFPINNISPSISIAAALSNRLSIELNSNRSTTQKSGQLKDGDWLSGNISTPDVYSISDLVLNQKTNNVKGVSTLQTQHWSSGVKTIYKFSLGYRSSQRYFVASNLNQFYADSTRAANTHSGPVLHYNTFLQIPYWSVSVESIFRQLIFEFNLIKAPRLRLKDEDDHLIRKKLSRGSLKGSMIAYTFTLTYPLSQRLFGFVQYQYEQIDSQGKQTQYLYDTSSPNLSFLAKLDQTFSARNSIVLLGISAHTSMHTSRFITKRRNISTLNAKFGIAYSLYAKNRKNHFDPQLEFGYQKLTIGMAYEQGSNQVGELSRGTFTSIPFYVMFDIRPFRKIGFNIGSGYSLNRNTIDSQAKSYLAQKGTMQVQEKIHNAWFALMGIQYPVLSQSAMNIFIRYQHHLPQLELKNTHFHKLRQISLSSMKMGVLISF